MPDVLAEMVAGVLEVVASSGQRVAEGDPLVVLESMKMEIPVLAPTDGVVKEIRVTPGDRIVEGDVIAVIG